MKTHSILLLFLLLTAACTKSPVIVVSNLELVPSIKDALEKDLPDLKYEWRVVSNENFFLTYGNGISNVSKESRADLFFLPHLNWFYDQDQKGEFLDYDSLEFKNISSTWTDTEAHFKPAFFGALLPAWIPGSIPTPPKTWKQFWSQDYKGKIVATSPNSNKVFQIAYQSLFTMLTPEEFSNIKSLGALFPFRRMDVVEAIEKGTASIGVVALDILSTAVESGSKVRPLPFDDPMLFYAQLVGVAKSAKNRDGAKKLIDWFFSYEFQSRMTKEWSLFSAVGNIPPAEGLAKLEIKSDKLFRWDIGKREMIRSKLPTINAEIEGFAR